ncbi:AAA family ATPase [Burkholderia multivorans]|uniref:AAA family ATPase n=1 Tax=Burkholderia multivorans TaxID=87883 RepID=UPI0021BF16C0|nr:AAA family ATPase [Burkholderia multivorans]
MINIEWRNVAHGFNYKKYLQRQVQDVLDDLDEMQSDPKMAYYAKSGEFTVHNLTRISGALAARFNLAGEATLKKLDLISQLELGEHADVRKSLHTKSKVKTLLVTAEFPSGIEVSKNDIKRGFTILKKKGQPSQKVDFTQGQVKQEVVTNRRTSLELIFSLDKSFSYLFFSDKLSLEQKKALQEIIFDAKHKAMEEIISPMLVTLHGERGEMLFYDFMHLDNREQDPHIHIHSNVSNLIRLEDGTYRVIEPRELFKNGTAERVDFQFKSIVLQMMKERLPEIPIEAYDKDFQVMENKGSRVSEIKDFRVAFDDETTRAIRAKYTHDKKLKDRIDSDKRELYQKCQNALGILQQEFKDCLLNEKQYLKRVATVNEKYQEDYEFLSSRKYNKQVQRELVNKKEIVSLHEKQEQLVQKVSEIDIRLKAVDQVKEIRRAYTDEQILENLTNRSPKFTRNDLIKDIAKYRGLGVEAQYAADAILKKNPDIFVLPRLTGNSNSPYDQPTFTLRSLAELEHQNMELMRTLVDNRVAPHWVKKLIEQAEATGGFTFKEEQKEYLQNVFLPYGVSIVVGLPGTGKSFAMRHAVDIARTKGRKTYGLAPTGKVSSAIAHEAGTDYAATIDKFLIDVEQGKVALQSSDLVFVDEAGMIGTRNYNKLLRAVEAAGAKLVLIGDNNQLDPVSAGNTFNEFVKEHAGKQYTTILSEISRQKNQEALEVAQTVSGQKSMAEHGGTAQEQLQAWQTDRQAATHIREAFDLLETFGRVEQYDTTKEMLRDVIDRFSKAPDAYEQKILLASTNKTVDTLNSEIQQQRLVSNELGASIRVNGELFCVHDRVVIQKNNKEVKNGDFGTVMEITKDGSLLIKFDNGQRKMVNPEKTKLNLGYAMTVHKSQGVTKTQTFHVGEDSQLNNAQLFNVAATRNTQFYTLFAVKSEYQAIKESYCRASDKISLLEVREIINASSSSTNKPNLAEKFGQKRNRLQKSIEAEELSKKKAAEEKINSPEKIEAIFSEVQASLRQIPTYEQMLKRIVEGLKWPALQAHAWLSTEKLLAKDSIPKDLTGEHREFAERQFVNDRVNDLFKKQSQSIDHSSSKQEFFATKVEPRFGEQKNSESSEVPTYMEMTVRLCSVFKWNPHQANGWINMAINNVELEQADDLKRLPTSETRTLSVREAVSKRVDKLIHGAPTFGIEEVNPATQAYILRHREQLGYSRNEVRHVNDIPRLKVEHEKSHSPEPQKVDGKKKGKKKGLELGL